MHLAKPTLFTLCSTLAFALANPQYPQSNSWVVGFHRTNCDHSVSPGRVTGRGPRSCASVSGALCMNGSSDRNSHLKICGYHGANCNGLSTYLDDDHPERPWTVIYHDGREQTINSFRVIQGGNC